MYVALYKFRSVRSNNYFQKFQLLAQLETAGKRYLSHKNYAKEKRDDLQIRNFLTLSES